MLEGKHHSAEDCNYVESLKDEIKYFRAEKQMKTAIIKAMSEREKSLVPCLYSAEAPFLESSNGNPKLNSPNKSDSSEVLSNAVQITKEITNYQRSVPKTADKENPGMLYLLNVPKVTLLGIPVGTKIPEILRFWC